MSVSILFYIKTMCYYSTSSPNNEEFTFNLEADFNIFLSNWILPVWIICYHMWFKHILVFPNSFMELQLVYFETFWLMYLTVK